MKLGTLSSKHASLQLGICTALPPEMQDGIIEVSHVRVDPKRRRGGHGSALLNRVCAQADVAGLVLLLQVEPTADSPLTALQLEQWYSRFGFAVIQDEPKLMARQPLKTQILRRA